MRTEWTPEQVVPVWPKSVEEWHELFVRLDREYQTSPLSPLHHNKRCPLCRA